MTGVWTLATSLKAVQEVGERELGVYSESEPQIRYSMAMN